MLHLMKPGSAGSVDTALRDHLPLSQKAHVAFVAFSSAFNNLGYQTKEPVIWTLVGSDAENAASIS